MAAHEVPGLPELPDLPSIPIFPSKEIERRPPAPGRAIERADRDTDSRDGDRLDLSPRARAFNASRLILERVAAEFEERLRDGEPTVTREIAARLESELLGASGNGPQESGEAGDPVTLVLRELERAAARESGSDRAAAAREWAGFQARARDAVNAAFDGVRSRLSRDGQLDDATAERLDDAADRLVEGIDLLDAS